MGYSNLGCIGGGVCGAEDAEALKLTRKIVLPDSPLWAKAHHDRGVLLDLVDRMTHVLSVSGWVFARVGDGTHSQSVAATKCYDAIRQLLAEVSGGRPEGTG